MTQDEAMDRLNVVVDLIPPGSSNRPGTRIQPTHITIHNTANGARGADALMHARYVKGADARARQVSWHFTVDDLRCVKHLPTTEKGWHAGVGNSRSIGIEVCEHEGIDPEAASARAQLLAAVLMLALDIPRENVVTHQHWTGKDCPRVLLRASGGFATFAAGAAGFLSDMQAAPAIAVARAPSGAPPGLAAAGIAPLGLAAPVESPVARLAPIADQAAASVDMPVVWGADRGSDPRDHVAELERLVGRLTLDNQHLRQVVMDLHDSTREAS